MKQKAPFAEGERKNMLLETKEVLESWIPRLKKRAGDVRRYAETDWARVKMDRAKREKLRDTMLEVIFSDLAVLARLLKLTLPLPEGECTVEFVNEQIDFLEAELLKALKATNDKLEASGA